MKIMFLRFVAIFCLLAAITQPGLAEKKWTIKNVEIAAQVDFAGYMTVEEKRTYEFSGKFSYAFYELSRSGLLDVDHVQVLEDGEPYQLSEDKTPGTFRIQRDDDEKISIRWEFRPKNVSGKNSLREFTLRFRVFGAVRVHRDVAELYYKFVGTGWDRASEKVRANIQLPGDILKDDLRVWAHGPLHGSIERQTNGVVAMSIDHLPRRQFFEARVVFPKQAVAAAPPVLRDDREALPEILQQEARWAEAANREREAAAARPQWQAVNREKYFPWLWGALAAGIAFSFYMYQQYGRSLRRRHKTIDSTIPAEMPPAVANYVVNAHHLSSGALLATLFDLAGRGYLQLRQEKRVSRFLGFSSTSQEVTISLDEERMRFGAAELLPYEQQLLQFLRADLAQNRHQLSMTEIKKHAAKFQRFFGKWKKAVALQAGSTKLYDRPSIRASLITFGIWLLIIAGNAFGIYAMGEAALPFLITSIVFAPLSFLILRYNLETVQKLDRLQAFRRYLKRFPQTYQKYGADWQNADKLLIYATALNLSGAQIKPLVESINHERGDGAFIWFVGSGGSSMSDIGPAMAAMIDTAGAALSSASGVGGGASSGGGSGAGGSGGGAG